MKFPEEVKNIVREANTDNPSVIDDATEQALKKVLRLKTYDDLVDMLVEHAVHDLICDDRHNINTRIKHQTGEYYQTPKTVVGNSDAVTRVEASVYHYRIAGTSLGNVLGKDLLDIASNEDGKAEGHVFNSTLLRRLVRLVPKNKMVKNAITQKKLKAIFAELQVLQKKEDNEAA
jgi:hypothetical protein